MTGPTTQGYLTHTEQRGRAGGLQYILGELQAHLAMATHDTIPPHVRSGVTEINSTYAPASTSPVSEVVRGYRSPARRLVETGRWNSEADGLLGAAALALAIEVERVSREVDSGSWADTLADAVVNVLDDDKESTKAASRSALLNAVSGWVTAINGVVAQTDLDVLDAVRQIAALDRRSCEPAVVSPALIPVVRKLTEPGAVYFPAIVDQLPDEMSEPDLDGLRSAAAAKIYDTMMSGHMADLAGADSLLDRLGIRLAFEPKVANAINQCLQHLTMLDMSRLGMSQPPVQGEQDLDAARRALSGTPLSDVPEDELTQIVDVRGVVIHLMDRQQHDVASSDKRFVIDGERPAIEPRREYLE